MGTLFIDAPIDNIMNENSIPQINYDKFDEELKKLERNARNLQRLADSITNAININQQIIDVIRHDVGLKSHE